MPIVATGDQRQSIGEVLPALLDAGFHWLKKGLPVEAIKLVVFARESLAEAKALFIKQSKKLRKLNDIGIRDTMGVPGSLPVSTSPEVGVEFSRPSPNIGDEYEYDVFISYSHEDESAAQYFQKRLKKAGLRVFIDRLTIKVGAAWQQKIYEALDACNIVAVLYSPFFLQSKMCKEEFNIAKIRGRDTDRDVLFPLLINDVKLPTYMKMHQHIDCRISDKSRIEAAAVQLASVLRKQTRVQYE